MITVSVSAWILLCTTGLTPFTRSDRCESRPVARGRGQADRLLTDSAHGISGSQCFRAEVLPVAEPVWRVASRRRQAPQGAGQGIPLGQVRLRTAVTHHPLTTDTTSDPDRDLWDFLPTKAKDHLMYGNQWAYQGDQNSQWRRKGRGRGQQATVMLAKTGQTRLLMKLLGDQP